MLELKYYSVQRIENLKDFFLVSYVIIDDIYHQIIPDSIRFRRNYSKSKLSRDAKMDYKRRWLRNQRIYGFIFG